MKRTLLAAGVAALAMGLPATAALADGYNARPAYMQAKPKPKPKIVHKAKSAAKAQKQARHKPRVHHPKPHGHAVAHVRYEEFESVETSVTHEVNGRIDGPYRSYSERYVAPHRGCLPQAPCGYSTGGGHHGVSHGHGVHHGSAHGQHHGSMLGYGGYSGAYGASVHGHGARTIQPGFHYGPLTGGVGYGVDGGPVYGATTVIIRPSGYGYGYGRSSSSSSASAYSSSQAYGSGGYSSGGHDTRFGYGPTYGHGGHGYLGFKPSAYGYGVGQSGYGGFKR